MQKIRADPFLAGGVLYSTGSTILAAFCIAIQAFFVGILLIVLSREILNEDMSSFPTK